jgi:hypothetical protein
VALAAGVALAWLVATMGPAGTVTAATTGDTTGSTDTGGGAITRTETKTITEPARTDTVTETSTAQPPGNTSVTNRTVQVTPASTTTDQSSTSGLPWWGWALIGLGAVLIGLVMFMAGRHRSGRPPSGPAGTQPPPPGTGRTA